jgi:hypothetical protein
MLPNGDLTEMETRDYQYLANIDSESKFTQLVEIYVLDTVSEALRIIHDVSTSAPQANALKFTETPQFSSIWKSKWDVFYLVSV